MNKKKAAGEAEKEWKKNTSIRGGVRGRTQEEEGQRLVSVGNQKASTDLDLTSSTH